MNRYRRIWSIILCIGLCSTCVFVFQTQACKNIVACGDATAGDYNLLLKVRDPSRPGLQVLCMVPEGYNYQYHHPWSRKFMDFTVTHKFIGVATREDVMPHIVKPGMALSDAGLAFGDADTMSNWRNPLPRSWDDFDWIRYACQSAENEDEAVTLLTKDVVDELHAPGVSENLFVVGPEKGYLVEADAFHYVVEPVEDILVMSNYPKALWETQRHKKLPIAASFDTVKEVSIRKGRILHLNSLYGIKIVDIQEDTIIVRQVPFLKICDGLIRFTSGWVEINVGERETVGDYSVELCAIDGNYAQVKVSYVFKAWEDLMLEYISSKQGSITVKDMMNWSRLHREDVDGLRPMCEDRFTYESALISKIPAENYDLLSSSWFAANHACSSIYVPVHICDTEIFTPYTNGEAAQLSIDLLETYGHGALSAPFAQVEDVFLYEIDVIEQVAQDLKTQDAVSALLTIVDTGMQRQAWLTQQLWIEAAHQLNQNQNQHLIGILEELWRSNYSASLESMKNEVNNLQDLSAPDGIRDIIAQLACDICETRLDAVQIVGKNCSYCLDAYTMGKLQIQNGEYSEGFDQLQQAFQYSDNALKGRSVDDVCKEQTNRDDPKTLWFYFGYLFIGVLILLVCVLILLRTYQEHVEG